MKKDMEGNSKMTKEAVFKLKVVGGLHKDAELFLTPDIEYRIGSSDNCTIILADSGIEQEHLSFRIAGQQICIEAANAPVYLDGQPVRKMPSQLTDYQVISIGEAHLAIGPVAEPWPAILIPSISTVDFNTDTDIGTTALVLVNRKEIVSRKKEPKPNPLLVLFQTLRLWLSHSNRKILAAAMVFILLLGVYAYDTLTAVAAPPMAEGDIPPKSVLLSVVDGLASIKRTTLIGAGITEPKIALETQAPAATEDATDHLRQVLHNTWGGNLTETRIDERSVQIKGYNEENRAELMLNIEEDENGETTATGMTLSPKKKKAILSQMGDIIRVKVDAAEDMEGACTRILEKKGVKQAQAELDIETNEVTLKGRTQDSKTITSLYEIITRAFPTTKVNNQLQLQRPDVGVPSIAGVSIGAVSYVTQSDGSKVFEGGTLNNGCRVSAIQSDSINLECHGFKRVHRL